MADENAASRFSVVNAGAAAYHACDPINTVQCTGGGLMDCLVLQYTVTCKMPITSPLLPLSAPTAIQLLLNKHHSFPPHSGRKVIAAGDLKPGCLHV